MVQFFDGPIFLGQKDLEFLFAKITIAELLLAPEFIIKLPCHHIGMLAVTLSHLVHNNPVILLICRCIVAPVLAAPIGIPVSNLVDRKRFRIVC